MPDIHILLTFTAIGLMAAAMPGPDNIYVASQASMHGFKTGLVAMLGVMCGVVVHIVLALAGLSMIILTSVLAFEVLRWLGVIYLAYLSFKMLTAAPDKMENSQATSSNVARVFFQGLATNLFNPKFIVFFLALLPQFIDPSQSNVLQQTLLLGVIILGTAIMVFIAVNYIAASSGQRLKRSDKFRKMQSRIFGGMLGGSALLLAIANRR